MIWVLKVTKALKVTKDLKAQLAALTKARDEKVAAVLTPEQRKKVEDLTAAAKAKRKAKAKARAKKAKAAE